MLSITAKKKVCQDLNFFSQCIYSHTYLIKFPTHSNPSTLQEPYALASFPVVAAYPLRENSFCKEQSAAAISVTEKIWTGSSKTLPGQTLSSLRSAKLQLCWCVMDLHAVFCITGSSCLGARGACAHQNVIRPVNFPEFYFPLTLSMDCTCSPCRLSLNPVQHHIGKGSVLNLPVFPLRTPSVEMYQSPLLPTLLPICI